MSASVQTSVENGVATLRLCRGKQMNSFDADTARAIRDAVESFARDDAVRVMVLAGEGKVFSAGGDFNWVLTWPEMDAITRHAGADAMMGAVQASTTSQAVDRARPWRGGGRRHRPDAGLRLRRRAGSARFGLTSVRNGLLAAIAIPVLIETVGPRVARQLLMHGGMFDSATALRLGLVDQVVESDMLDATVAALAGELKLGAPSVQTLIKKLVTQMDAAAARFGAADILGGHVANQSSPRRRSKA